MSDAAATPAPFRFHFGKAAMIGAAVMVCVTGFTTGSGLLAIVGVNRIYIVVMATIAIQLMLAISAWFLGQELARYVLRSRLGPGVEPPSAPLTAVAGCVFVATFLLSFFFAFSFWFSEFHKLSQQAEDARNLPNSFQIAVMSPLREAVKTTRESELSDPSKDAVVGPWLSGMEKVIDAAQGQGRVAIDQRFKDRADAARKAREAAQASATERRDGIGRAKDNLRQLNAAKGSTQKSIDEIKQRLAPVDERLVELSKEKNEFDALYIQECAGVKGSKLGCGPKAARAKQNADAKAREIAQTNAPTRPDRVQLANLEQTQLNTTARIADESRKLDELGAAAPSEPAAGDAPAPPVSIGVAGIDGAVGTLRDRIREFLGKGTPATYQDAANACGTILQALTNAKVPGLPAIEMSCESSGVLQKAQTRPQREKARTEFESECGPGKMTEAAVQASKLIPHGQAGVDPQILGQSFETINGKIQSCINIAAATGAAVGAVEAIRAGLARTEAPDRDRFDEAWKGLWNGGAHRTAAVLLAAVFDLMILGLSFFADLFNIRGHAKQTAPAARRLDLDVRPNPQDPLPLAGAKALRRLARYDVKLRRCAIDPNGPDMAGLDTDLRSQVHLRLDSLLQDGRAEQLRDGRCALSEAGLTELEALVQAQASPAAPTAAGRPHGSADLQPAGLAAHGAGARTTGSAADRRGGAGSAGGHRPPLSRPRPLDLGEPRWAPPSKRPAQNNVEAAARQAAPAPDQKDATIRAADAARTPGNEAYGIAELMDQRRGGA